MHRIEPYDFAVKSIFESSVFWGFFPEQITINVFYLHKCGQELLQTDRSKRFVTGLVKYTRVRTD